MRINPTKSVSGTRVSEMKKEYFDPNFIGPVRPTENLTERRKAAVVKVILRYSDYNLIYVTDRSEDASQAIAS